MATENFSPCYYCWYCFCFGTGVIYVSIINNLVSSFTTDICNKKKKNYCIVKPAFPTVHMTKNTLHMIIIIDYKLQRRNKGINNTQQRRYPPEYLRNSNVWIPCYHPALCVYSSVEKVCKQMWHHHDPGHSSPPTSRAPSHSHSPSS